MKMSFSRASGLAQSAQASIAGVPRSHAGSSSKKKELGTDAVMVYFVGSNF
jgi:hypothetical protein